MLLCIYLEVFRGGEYSKAGAITLKGERSLDSNEISAGGSLCY